MDTRTLTPQEQMPQLHGGIDLYDVLSMTQAERDATRPERMQAFSAFIMSKSEVFIDAPLETSVDDLHDYSQATDTHHKKGSAAILARFEQFDDPSTPDARYDVSLQRLVDFEDSLATLEARKKHSKQAVKTSQLEAKPVIDIDDADFEALDDTALSLLDASNEIQDKKVSLRAKSYNVLSNASRKACEQTFNALVSIGKGVERLIPSKKMVAGAGIFVAAYAIMPDYYRFDGGMSERAQLAAVATQNSAPTQTAEVTPSTTIEVQETVAPTTSQVVETTEPAPETTMTTVAEVVETAPETTAPELSLYERVMQNEADRKELAGNLIAQIDMPSQCLYGIDAYGSQTRDYNDPVVLDYFVSQGLLNETQRALLLSPKPPKEVIVQFEDLVNPIYKTYAAEVPQAPCDSVGLSSVYPPRWERTFIDSSDKDVETEPVTNYEPVVDIDWQKALPGEAGNVVIVGHRTTKSAPFANLDQAKIGDPIVIHTDDGNSHIYVVEGSRYINATDAEYRAAVDGYVSPSGNTATMTLVSCNDGSKQRLIVYATLLP